MDVPAASTVGDLMEKLQEDLSSTLPACKMKLVQSETVDAQ